MSPRVLHSLSAFQMNAKVAMCQIAAFAVRLAPAPPAYLMPTCSITSVTHHAPRLTMQITQSAVHVPDPVLPAMSRQLIAQVVPPSAVAQP